MLAILNGINDLLTNPNPLSPAQNEAHQEYILDDGHERWLRRVERQVYSW